MSELIRKSLRDSAAARWTAMTVVAFTMLCGYYVADVAAPLKTLMEQQLGWTSTEYGDFTGSYTWFNVFLGMLVIGGIILDRWGARVAGLLAMVLMLGGCTLKWWAIGTHSLDGTNWLGFKAQVLLASLGYATFGMGLELCGITATKIIVRWFKGYEIALAMGLQVAIARIGTSIALGSSAPVAKAFSVSTPILVGVLLLGLGLVAFLIYITMDRKLDASEPASGAAAGEDAFRLSDILSILSNKGWWYISILCALFYSGVFPFLKYASDLMVQKFGVAEDLSGLIPSLLPFGAMLLTPTFGRVYDKKGKGATIMILGSLLIMLVHVVFTLPFLDNWLIAVFAMLLLGVGFSLVPSAMWPSVPKLIPERQLGTAYSLIFFMQNLIALMAVPMLIGRVLDAVNPEVVAALENARETLKGQGLEAGQISEKIEAMRVAGEIPTYDYTWPMAIFTCCGLLAIVVALLLKREDRVKGYGLELPNQKA
jgi:MFS family permease